MVPQSDSSCSARRQNRTAAVLQRAQGVLMEGRPFLGLAVYSPESRPGASLTRGLIHRALLQRTPLPVMMAMGGVFGTLRIIGSIGLLKNRLWGYALSLINCSVTLVL